MKAMIIPVYSSDATDIDLAVVPLDELRKLAGHRRANSDNVERSVAVSHLPYYLVSWQLPDDAPDVLFDVLEEEETRQADIDEDWLEQQPQTRLDFSRAEIGKYGIFWEFLEHHAEASAETDHVRWEEIGILPPGENVTQVNWSHVTDIDRDEEAAEGGPTPEQSAREALQIVLDYWGAQGETELETAITDLMVDLMHLARMNGCDAEEMLEKARRHHDAERLGQR